MGRPRPQGDGRGVYLIVLIGRLLVQPVHGIPPIGLYEGGSYANLGVFTVAAIVSLLSLRLATILGARDRWRARLGTVQAWLAVAVGTAALILLGRYGYHFGLTRTRLVGYGVVAVIVAMAVAQLATRWRGGTAPAAAAGPGS